MTAVTILTPALLVLPSPMTGGAAQKPVSATQEAAPLIDPERPEVGDGDVASARDVALAKENTPEVAEKADEPVVLGATARKEITPDLAVIGVTWQGDAPLAVQYRTEGPDGWGAWHGVDTDTGDTGENDGAQVRAGSDPIVLTGAIAVQARILGAEGDEPSDPQLSVIDPGEGRADATADQAGPGAANASAARPTIHSRRAWGADESLRRSGASYGNFRGTIVHHTAGTNNYSQAQVPAILRGIYAFHTRDRGWNDIGYNFLVDKWGRVWEGRAGGMDRAVVGAHASGFNAVTMGISLMGDYSRVQPSAAAIDAMTRTIAWNSSVHGYDPRARFTHNGRSYRNVSGHRDVGSTSCPGLIYNSLTTMATRAASMRGNVGATTPAPQRPGVNPPPATPTAGLNVADAMLLNGSGHLFAVSPSGANNITSARRINAGNWRGFDRIMVSPDFSGDRFPDVISRRASDGALFMHPGAGTGVQSGRQIGQGWGVMSHILAVGDWNGDGRADLVAVHGTTGRLMLYPGAGGGTFGRATQIGQGWGVFSHVLAVGDWDGDGRPDIVGITPRGDAFLYRGTGRGGFHSGRVALGNASGYSRYVGMAGARGILAIRPDGRADMLRSTNNRFTAHQVGPHFRGLHVHAG
ncbi:MAG: FG-GAP-like repeat-containing protein [Mobilicoccus sp.]|nr:FG-GAP-like repeat-containing protein [Mobilicoccus sp.]